jgi:hypothetical protein
MVPATALPALVIHAGLLSAGAGLSQVRGAGPGADDADDLAELAALAEGERFARPVKDGGNRAVVHPMPTTGHLVPASGETLDMRRNGALQGEILITPRPTEASGPPPLARLRQGLPSIPARSGA